MGDVNLVHHRLMYTVIKGSVMLNNVKDMSYGSGERQTATRIASIRKDHIERYLYAVRMITTFSKDVDSIGDIFCGNGYGTWLLATRLTPCSITGIDGSAAAIDIAKGHYCTNTTTYTHTLFPFTLSSCVYSAIVCLESIEHVNDPPLLFRTLASALKPAGVLVLSSPNEHVIPFSKNKKWFRHHVRHFTDQDILKFADSCGMSEINRAGQSVYTLKRGKVKGLSKDATMSIDESGHEHQFTIFTFKKN